MAGISNILVRMRELAVQSANGTNGTTDRAAIQTEVTALIAQIGDIAGRTDFNGNNLLDGSVATGFDIQTGLNTGETVNITIGDQIGRASCRARVCQYVSISVAAVSLKKKK